MSISKSIGFQIFHGVTGGVACSLSLLGISFLTLKQYESLFWSQEQRSYFWKKKLYLPLVLGFPVGFIVGYSEKTVVQHLSPLIKLKFDSKIQ